MKNNLSEKYTLTYNTNIDIESCLFNYISNINDEDLINILNDNISSLTKE